MTKHGQDRLEGWEKTNKRPMRDMAVMAATLEFLAPFPRICGGVLDDDDGFYFGYLLGASPPRLTNDDHPLNESKVVIRTIDIPFLRNLAGRDVTIRAVIAAYTPELADIAETRMRAGVRRMQDEAKATR